MLRHVGCWDVLQALRVMGDYEGPLVLCFLNSPLPASWSQRCRRMKLYRCFKSAPARSHASARCTSKAPLSSLLSDTNRSLSATFAKREQKAETTLPCDLASSTKSYSINAGCSVGCCCVRVRVHQVSCSKGLDCDTAYMWTAVKRW